MIPEQPTAPKRESPRQQVQLPTVLFTTVMESIRQSASPWVVDRLEIRGPEIIRLNIEIETNSKLSSSESTTLSDEISKWIDDEYFDAVSGGPSALGWLSKENQDLLEFESLLAHQLHQQDKRIQNCSIRVDQGTGDTEDSTKRKLKSEAIEWKAGQIPLRAKLDIKPISSPVRPSSSNNGDVTQT